MDFKLKKSELGFKVYTVDTKPTAPGANNDIAVITSVPMANWIMSPDKPSGIPRSEGDVWIQYSVKGKTTFNALKNNSMIIATISAWQYVDGVWVDVEAVSCQNGEWVSWITYYFRSGIGTVVEFESSMQTNGVCTIGTDKITFLKNAEYSNVSCACTKDKQRLKAGNVVIFDAKCTWQNTDSSGQWARVVGIYSSKPNIDGLPTDNAASIVYLEADSVRKQYKVRVKNDGMYYIASCGAGDAEIYDIYSQ